MYELKTASAIEKGRDVHRAAAPKIEKEMKSIKSSKEEKKSSK
jgi:hypothetical protein